MLIILMFIVHSHVHAYTECERKFGGTCVNFVFNKCLSGYTFSYDGCGFQEMCCIPRDDVTIAPPLAQGHCGITFPDPLPASHRIVGGDLTAPGEFPWQVSLRAYDAFKGHMCGGILIDEKWILTAAHCFREDKNPFAWNAVLGEYDRAVTDGHEKIVKVETLIIHKNFNDNYGNDIAMLKIATPINAYGKYIRPVCLPDKNETFKDLYCTVTGWGAIQSGGLGTRRMLKVSVPVLSQEVCSYLMDKTVPLTEICAGSKHGGHDACQGDSGGPLVCYRNGVWKVAGIVSWGYGCAQAYTPGIYTNVAHYRDWMASVMSYYTNHRKRGAEITGVHYV